MPDDKFKKLSRMAAANPRSPLPPIPKLSDKWKVRLPELAEEIDEFNRMQDVFFKGSSG